MIRPVPPLIDPLDADGDPAGRVAKRVVSFTRRGRRMPERLEAALAEGAAYVLDPPRAAGETTVRADWRLDLQAAYGRRAPLVVEVGSGHGDQIVAAAAAHPERDHLALEVWAPGVARTVELALEAGVTNLRVLPADAAVALPTALPHACAAEVWTFFPDPWRKTRHHKRRLVQPSFAASVARLLVDAGRWRLATDWTDYAEHMREVLRGAAEFTAPQGQRWDTADAWSPRFGGRLETHFEKRGARAGRETRDLEAVRVPRGSTRG